ncbi:hypothetical protein [Halomonas aquatica]|uniref:Uncharacterized protein n=1 Tax=Halomonas aquatica TaxID=3151123 RepID=A0ABV1NAH1_9GAMM
MPVSSHIKGDEIIIWKDEVLQVDGVWDLPMLAAEKASVKKLYQKLISGPKDVLWELDGAWIQRDGIIYCLQEKSVITSEDFSIFPVDFVDSDAGKNVSDRWHPMSRLPDDSKVVIRRQNLDAFIESLDLESSHKLAEGDELRNLEAFGLLVELYASKHGPDYRHGIRPKASRIVKDMLDIMPSDVTNMGDRKLKEHVSAAVKAWESKKRQ